MYLCLTSACGTPSGGWQRSITSWSNATSLPWGSSSKFFLRSDREKVRGKQTIEDIFRGEKVSAKVKKKKKNHPVSPSWCQQRQTAVAFYNLLNRSCSVAKMNNLTSTAEQNSTLHRVRLKIAHVVPSESSSSHFARWPLHCIYFR